MWTVVSIVAFFAILLLSEKIPERIAEPAAAAILRVAGWILGVAFALIVLAMCTGVYEPSSGYADPADRIYR